MQLARNVTNYAQILSTAVDKLALKIVTFCLSFSPFLLFVTFISIHILQFWHWQEYKKRLKESVYEMRNFLPLLLLSTYNSSINSPLHLHITSSGINDHIFPFKPSFVFTRTRISETDFSFSVPEVSKVRRHKRLSASNEIYIYIFQFVLSFSLLKSSPTVKILSTLPHNSLFLTTSSSGTRVSP